MELPPTTFLVAALVIDVVAAFHRAAVDTVICHFRTAGAPAVLLRFLDGRHCAARCGVDGLQPVLEVQ